MNLSSMFSSARAHYVGETTMECRNRINSHKSTIRTRKIDLPVTRNFSEARHNVSELRFACYPLTRGGNRQKLLKQKEVYSINKLDTKYPKGLNLDDPLEFVL